jgi:hypothetical protein
MLLLLLLRALLHRVRRLPRQRIMKGRLLGVRQGAVPHFAAIATVFLYCDAWCVFACRVHAAAESLRPQLTLALLLHACPSLCRSLVACSPTADVPDKRMWPIVKQEPGADGAWELPKQQQQQQQQLQHAAAPRWLLRGAGACCCCGAEGGAASSGQYG